jgi:chloramphenicol 3-O-phosphotransferase
MGLKFWERKPLEKPFSEKLSRRVSKIPTADLSMWIEQALSETNRSMSAYLSSGNNIHLDDALVGAEAINALVSELHRRTVV